MQKAHNVLNGKCLAYTYSRLNRFEHVHTRFEIVIPAQGRVAAQLDRKQVEVLPGEMLVVFPGVLHRFDPAQTSTGLMLTFYAELLPEQGSTLSEMQPTEPVVRISEVDSDVAYCVGRLGAMESGPQVDEAIAHAYLTLLFTHLTPVLKLVKSDPAASKDLLYRAMKYMSEHLTQPLSLKETAHALGVNSYYLSHVLNERIHMGFRTYLNTMRIDRARRYLRLTTWPVEEVAAACGFGTLRTFDRVFSEYCGCTPREFRKAAEGVSADK